MKYYLHDSNSFNDEKVTLLYIEFGYEGVGLFYVILEKLSQQEKPVPERVLKIQLNIGKKLNKVLNFMYKIDILSVKNGEVFSETLLNFSEKYQIKKEKTKKRVSEWRDKQKDKENVTCYEHVRNSPKVKLSKVKLSKVNNNIEFDIFWNFYDKKVGKKEKIETKWNKLTLEVQQKIIDYIPKYIESQPDKKYRKNPETFLNNESWNDEIIGKQKPEKLGDSADENFKFN